MPTTRKKKKVVSSPPKSLVEQLTERFTDIADWVSSAMGTPANIIIWLILVLGWTFMFAIAPSLQNSNFLPGWFTSQSYNFPLNLVTTVAELFIGFLVAAASNRIERRNHQQIQQMERMERQNARMEREHGKMLDEMRGMMKDIHSHTYCLGHTTIEPTLPPDPPDDSRPVHHPDLTAMTQPMKVVRP